MTWIRKKGVKNLKRFNTTAICVPEKHYMVDITDKIEQVKELIESGEYFTINWARQYGKTTIFYSLLRNLKDRYLVLLLSFEGLGDGAFSSDEALAKQFIISVTDFLETIGEEEALINEWKKDTYETDCNQDGFDYLSKKITKLCKNSKKEILLLIDEVDKSSDNQVFLHFLGMLRNKYITQTSHIRNTVYARIYKAHNLYLFMKQYNFQGRYWKPSALSELMFFQRT